MTTTARPTCCPLHSSRPWDEGPCDDGARRARTTLPNLRPKFDIERDDPIADRICRFGED